MTKDLQISYCVFIQDNQESSIKSLINLTEISDKKDNDLKNLIESFIKDNKDDALIGDLFYISNLLDYIGLIECSFSEYIKIKNTKKSDNYEELIQKKRIFVECFFHNASLFIKTVKNYTNIDQKLQFKKLLKDITVIRDYFEHADFKDKDVPNSKVGIVSFQGCLGTNLDYLHLVNIENNERIGTLYFSLSVFYFSLRDIFNELKKTPKLLIK